MRKKLLEEKKLEFQKLYKMTHEEYGFPYVGIAKYEVVFAKTSEALSLYKKKRLREDRKALVAIITVIALVVTTYILLKTGNDKEIISNATFGILLTGFISCFAINYNANHKKLNKEDIIVLFSRKNFDYLDFPSPKI